MARIILIERICLGWGNSRIKSIFVSDGFFCWPPASSAGQAAEAKGPGLMEIA